MVLGDLDKYMQKPETRPTYTIHQNKLKMDKRLTYMSCKDTIKVLEDNIGRKISDIPRSSIFTSTSSRARDIKERMNKWDYIKLKSFCMAKEIANKMGREPAVWKTYLPKHICLGQWFDLQNI